MAYKEIGVYDDKNKSQIEIKKYHDGTAYAVVRSRLGGGQMVEIRFSQEDIKNIINALTE